MDTDNGYLDAQEALKRLGGSKDLYIRLLKQFVEGGFFDSLEKALAAKDFEAAVRGAHTIKGTSANLSLLRLTTAALELEQKLKDGEDFDASFAALKEIYDATSQQITAYCNI